ncbi:TonB-linked outer membrane protein, SusC/RagA family [bacterium A37T11]|nr:TonB-linked outer membrane protein, SusC/RagA family [bacterium A37T11]
MKFKQRIRTYIYVCSMLISANISVSTPVQASFQITIHGKVIKASDGKPIAGVSVKVKATGKTVSTNNQGIFEIGVSDERTVLIFSYVGFTPKELSVKNQRELNVSLSENAEGLQEVVVTALGLKREARSLGYSVGTVSSKELNRVVNENVLTGIAGKVPGVSISSTGTTGSSVSMVIRGATSLNGDNQPLFVVDGVPIANSLNNVSQVGNQNVVDYGNALSSLNPEDIESISVLKGASAAALYGSRAGNGVVLITTKSGKGLGKTTVDFNSNTVFDVPYHYLDMQHKFASGVLPFTPDANTNPGGILEIDEHSSGGVGPELNKGYLAIQWNSPLDADGNPIPTPLISHPDNVKNFVQTGITSTNGLSIANSTEKLNYRLSYANMSNRGIIPNADLFRNSLNLNSSLKVRENLQVSAQVDFSRNNSNSRPASNRGTNPLQWAYAVSPHIDIRDLKDYWVPGQEGLQQLSQAPGDYNNPYFLAYEVKNSFVRDRVFGNVRADWQITPAISIMGRYSLDTYNETRQSIVPNSYTEEVNGAFGITNLHQLEQNIDFLASYKKVFPNFSLNVSAGGNTRYNRSDNVSNATKNGTGMVIPGLYTLSNISSENLAYSSYLSKKAVNSVYGLVNLGYKDLVYLDVTARNDWSSTLPIENRSYFYPSASLSVLLNDIFNMPTQINLLKLRGGVAQVGNDTDPYKLMSVLANAGAWGTVTQLATNANLLLPSLKPEIQTSYEGGLDLGMFQNRLHFEGTYYRVENKNQILSSKLPGSSGYTGKNINAGLLVSRGLELSLGGTPIKSENWQWDVNVNWSRNRTRIVELTPGTPYYQFWSDGGGSARTYVGDDIGNLYDKEIVTVKDPNSEYYGYPILDEHGSWQSVPLANSHDKIGNFNPDFSLGLQTSINYKSFTLGLSADIRVGGEFVSQTYRYFESDLKTQRFLDKLINPHGLSGDALRNYLVDNNLVRIKGNYFPIVGGPTAEYGGYPFEIGDVTLPYATFNPGVIASYDNAGNVTYTENLGGPGTQYIPYGDDYPWDYMRAATFDASYIKLREISFTYNLPKKFASKLGMQNASIGVFSRNILLWTKAGIGVDPETAFQPEGSVQGGVSQFKQGIERYNVTPWTIPVGFKLSVIF